MIAVRVIDIPLPGVGRNHDHRDARTVSEEVDRLNVAGVVQPARFIRRNEDSRLLPDGILRLDRVDDVAGEGFEQQRQ